MNLQGSITDSVGGGSLSKSGPGTLNLNGSPGNTYTGSTTISEGRLLLNKTSGYAIPGNLTMSTAPDTPGIWTSVPATYVIAQGAGQIAPSCLLTFTNFNGDNYAHFELYGHSMTLAGISGIGIVQNTETETGVGSSTLTINNSADYWFGGYLRKAPAAAAWSV